MQLKRTRLKTVIAAILLASYLLYFPGIKSFYAFAIGSGIGLTNVQKKINELEDRAISKSDFSEEDKIFLSHIYRTLALGARLTIIIGQTADLMDHYLNASGAPLQINPNIFRNNVRVQEMMKLLKAKAEEQLKLGKTAITLTSEKFYMPHPSSIDSIFGLYWGTLQLNARYTDNHNLLLKWRAEVPWEWPSYESIRAKYRTAHAETFPIPNLLSLFLGNQFALRIDNGLGEYLTKIGLAKSFLAFADWEDPIK